jgi:hypothetical protein
MKKKIIISIIILVIIVSLGLILLLPKREYTNENTLYYIKFDNTILRFQYLDSVIGQNQIVGVEKSIDDGKTFERITTNQVIVSLEPKFVFLNENMGFAVKKPNNIKDNGKYFALYVTTDGGKTFNNSIINYDNPDVSLLTIEDVPYYENNLLKLHCSIYVINEEKQGYENKDLYFISNDNGLTWNLIEEGENDLTMNVIINNHTYLANLENNDTVNEFIKLLPKEFNMNELNGNEKYIYLDNNLPSNPVNVKNINKGDIMLYGDNCLVIFYKSFNTSYSYTKIGHIDNLSDLGNDNILVKIEK